MYGHLRRGVLAGRDVPNSTRRKNSESGLRQEDPVQQSLTRTKSLQPGVERGLLRLRPSYPTEEESKKARVYLNVDSIQETSPGEEDPTCL